MHTDSDTDCISKLSRNRELQQRLVVLMKSRGDGLTVGEPERLTGAVCLSKAKGTLRLRTGTAAGEDGSSSRRQGAEQGRTEHTGHTQGVPR